MSGPGYHTGLDNEVELLREAAEGGWVEIGAGRMRATGPSASEPETADRCTRVGGVGPLEHLAAAAAIAGLPGWILRARHPDLPLLDGSALPWSALLPVGLDRERVPGDAGFRPVHLADRRGGIEAFPASEFSVEVEWTDGPFGPESWEGGSGELPALLPARTFVRADDWWAARSVGGLLGAGPRSGRLLAPKRADLPREALELLDREGVRREGEVWTGSEERLPCECAAHKALDLVGDIAIALGYLPPIRIKARNAGHPLHAQLGRALRESMDRARG